MKRKTTETTSKIEVSRFILKWFVILTLLSLVVYQVFSGIHLKKIGIPGVMEVEFGDASGNIKHDNLLRFDGYYYHDSGEYMGKTCLRFYDDDIYQIMSGEISPRWCMTDLHKASKYAHLEYYEQKGDEITIELSDAKFTGRLSKNELLLKKEEKEELFRFSTYIYPPN